MTKVQFTILSFTKKEKMKKIFFGLILCHVIRPVQGQTAKIREVEINDNEKVFMTSFPIETLVPGDYINVLIDLKVPKSNNYENIFATKFTFNQRRDKVYRSVYNQDKI